MKFRELWQELKDRRVVRVAIGYTVVAAVIVQAADLTLEPLGLPGSMNSLRTCRAPSMRGRPRRAVRRSISNWRGFSRSEETTRRLAGPRSHPP